MRMDDTFEWTIFDFWCGHFQRGQRLPGILLICNYLMGALLYAYTLRGAIIPHVLDRRVVALKRGKALLD